MKVSTAVKDSRWRVVLLATVLTGALASTAFAAVTLTLDPTAQLSPGRLHATLTGTATCDGVSSVFLNGQITQSGRTHLGSTSVACDGTSQPYAIDVSAGFGSSFKAGRASAQVVATICGGQPLCTSTYTDAIIRLKK
jgi:hypothetical protein